jgi:hypothetical protein
MSKKSNVETMGKAELRAACKAAGISYSKLTTEGMRNALTIRAAVNAVDAESKGRSAPTGDEAALDAEPVVTTAAQVAPNAPVAAPAAETTPAPAVAPAKAKKVAAPKAPKVAAEVRNGIQRPRAGGACDAVWSALDKLHAAGTVPTSKDARDLATANGWNQNNSLCELSRWRRFNGIQKAQVSEAAAS